MHLFDKCRIRSDSVRADDMPQVDELVRGPAALARMQAELRVSKPGEDFAQLSQVLFERLGEDDNVVEVYHTKIPLQPR